MPVRAPRSLFRGLLLHHGLPHALRVRPRGRRREVLPGL